MSKYFKFKDLHINISIYYLFFLELKFFVYVSQLIKLYMVLLDLLLD